MKLFVLLTITRLACTISYSDVSLHRAICKPIPYEACKNVGYNFTAMPNLVGMELESEANYGLGSFKPLVKFGCSSQLEFFLCSMYAPMCVPTVPTLIGPCRPLCEGVRQRCEPVLRSLGYPWPAAFNCSKLPKENREEHMCMEGPQETVPLQSSAVPSTYVTPYAPSHCVHLAQPQLYVYINASMRCVPLCGAHIVFSGADKSIIGIFMSICAITTFAIGLFILISLLLDSSLYKYPDKAAAHICLCFTLVATGYLIRLASGSHSISCKKDQDLGIFVMITEGTSTTPCIIVFLFLYYFSMAAGVWWVLHCACWLLRAWNRGLSHERFLQHSSLLHALGWGIPAALTITCLVLRKVEADELTGTCFAGGKDPISLIRWVIVPQFLFIILGSSFLILTYACLWRSRADLVHLKQPHRHIAVSAARIGVMAIFYMVPATCVLSSALYEMTNRDKWTHEIGVRPRLEVFMLKTTMNLAPGLLLGLFLINSKVLTSWKRFFRRNFSSKRPTPTYIRGPALMGGKKIIHNGSVAVQMPSTHTPVVAAQHCIHFEPQKISKKKINKIKTPETNI